MGEINLAFVDCKDCRKKEHSSEEEKEWWSTSIRAFKARAKGTFYIGFPVIAKDTGHGKDCLPKVPKHCPFCGSQNLDFTDTSSEYFG